MRHRLINILLIAFTCLSASWYRATLAVEYPYATDEPQKFRCCSRAVKRWGPRAGKTSRCRHIARFWRATLDAHKKISEDAVKKLEAE